MSNKPTQKSGGLNRRQFVKNTALATGGLMMTSNMALAAKAHIDGEGAIKVGLVGCGGRGTGAIVQALLANQNVRLVAMADAFRDKTLIQRHRLVYDAVGDIMHREIHALSIQAKTPDET